MSVGTRSAATSRSDAPVAHLLDEPHHDGSEVYVPQRTPRLGEVVPVRFRVPASCTERAVWVRTVRDAEPRMVPARLDSRDDHERWYVAEVPVHNPVTSYRALLDEPGGYRWLNGRGTHARDVTDAADFRLTVHPPAPAWLNDAIVYQIFPDRFSRSDARHDAPEWAVATPWDEPPAAHGRSTAVQYYGGDLPGIEQRLDHLERLGVDTIYLTPIFPARSVHRYDASTFDSVDPLLGGDDALASLSAAVHARRMRLIGDITTNHTGAGHEWFSRALTDPTSEEASYYYWLDAEPGYVGWYDLPSLPKLNYRAPSLRRRMIDGPGSVIGRFLREPFSLDGWRVDVANMTGRYAADDFTHAIARTIRQTMGAINPDAVLISEHFHDAGPDLAGDGWNANMNYAAFTRPLWTWLVDPCTPLDFLGIPTQIPRRDGVAMVDTMREFGATVPWQVTAHQWNMLGSHDTPRIRTVVGDPALVEVAAGLLFTLPGTPVLFAGDEIGVEGTTGEGGRVPMPWGHPETWDTRTFGVYRALIRLRRSARALREGGMRWAVVAADAVAFLRETHDERVLVVAARGPWPGAELPRHLLAPDAAPENLYGGADLAVGSTTLRIPGEGPGVQVWRLA